MFTLRAATGRRLFLLLLTVHLILCDDIRYEANWESLDSRPLPTWYDEAKFGIFIHWGVYSVPSYSLSYGAEWFWFRWKENRTEFVEFMENNYPETFSYQQFATDFTAQFFNASEWAEMFVKSGAKYVVLTSKHHEGFHLWPSKYGYSWNSVDLGPHRDIVGELSEAVRNEGLIFGAYHSLFEWFHPLYVSDKESNFTTNDFVQNKIFPEMQELVEKYNVSIFWSDGAHEAPASHWKSTEFLAWLYNDSPVKEEVVANDRWGASMSCHHGGVYTCRDRYNPGTLQKHKWENAMTIDKASWGFRRNAKLSDYFTTAELISQLVSTVSCGGNLLMNIGPTSYGTISPIYEERLLQMGQWLAINGEAIYGTSPWSSQNDTTTTGVWYTTKDKAVYAIALHWPQHNMENTLTLGSVLDLFLDTDTTVTLLGNEDDGSLEWTVVDDVDIKFPDKNVVKSEWAWTLKIQLNINNKL